MTPQEQSVPAPTKWCQKHLHEISISTKRCQECRKAYFRKYRTLNREHLNSLDRERYRKKHEGQLRKYNGSPGGIARATKSRREALDKYYSNPKICKNCGGPIVVKDGEKIPQARKRTFCTRRCAAIFNNHLRKKERACKTCGGAVRRTSKRMRNYCDDCLNVKLLAITGKISKRALFTRRNGYQSARSQIRRHAETVFNRSGKKKVCAICGYSLYVEIAHLRAVADFSEDALIEEINAVGNLIAFCANHHWEFDNDKLVEDNVTAEWTGDGSSLVS